MKQTRGTLGGPREARGGPQQQQQMLQQCPQGHTIRQTEQRTPHKQTVTLKDPKKKHQVLNPATKVPQNQMPAVPRFRRYLLFRLANGSSSHSPTQCMRVAGGRRLQQLQREQREQQRKRTQTQQQLQKQQQQY